MSAKNDDRSQAQHMLKLSLYLICVVQPFFSSMRAPLSSLNFGLGLDCLLPGCRACAGGARGDTAAAL
jgi:hypothetical protein